ncbi:unnamed protein product [Rotaria socialis]|uniref:Cell division cycle protein 123 homolog n=1 Tax=Rotaria socialis TaxID=392032 RepID=A0A821EKS1_9BILA|nr:unnamed protein product [Rotaria socialis]CAF3393892.1 unnamed protein product [Rotaria socialis]CAF3524047.1 unnamed protein product [Rotaria socialis]CAF4138343.1 unnamed protein product [Rotaria socialis]CAF4296672.1 unnamed protein product [Rotaria socialis]
MPVENDIFSNKTSLKNINKNFVDLINVIQSIYESELLCSTESSEIKEISFEYLQEFNGSNQNQQIDLLSVIKDFEKLCLFLSLNPMSYECHYFIAELYQLALHSLAVRRHLTYYCEDILLKLCICYDDDLRFASLKIVSLLMNESQPVTKEKILYLNRICYECLYDFDIYYDYIKSCSIESRIIHLTKQDFNDLINRQCIRKDLEHEIVESIEELGGDVFIKMHRSPKDAYQNLCKEINNDWNRYWNLKPHEDPQLYFMKIQNISQLTLLFKTSDRLREDFQQISSDGKLILRKWIHQIPNEYRCFICNRQLNALSAYKLNPYSISDEKQLEDFINSKSFQDIILNIPYSHAVIDCLIDSINYQVTIIEINPFSKRSSSAKFSWIIDKNTLYNNYLMNQSVFIKL